MSARPFASTVNSAPTGRILMEIVILAFSENLSKKIQTSLKSDNNNGYFTRRRVYIYDIISLGSS
jgi:hypothetical protein